MPLDKKYSSSFDSAYSLYPKYAAFKVPTTTALIVFSRGWLPQPSLAHIGALRTYSDFVSSQLLRGRRILTARIFGNDGEILKSTMVGYRLPETHKGERASCSSQEAQKEVISPYKSQQQLTIPTLKVPFNVHTPEEIKILRREILSPRQCPQSKCELPLKTGSKKYSQSVLIYRIQLLVANNTQHAFTYNNSSIDSDNTKVSCWLRSLRARQASNDRDSSRAHSTPKPTNIASPSQSTLHLRGGGHSLSKFVCSRGGNQDEESIINIPGPRHDHRPLDHEFIQDTQNHKSISESCSEDPVIPELPLTPHHSQASGLAPLIPLSAANLGRLPSPASGNKPQRESSRLSSRRRSSRRQANRTARANRHLVMTWLEGTNSSGSKESRDKFENGLDDDIQSRAEAWVENDAANSQEEDFYHKQTAKCSQRS
jgi:hypothetical protein